MVLQSYKDLLGTFEYTVNIKNMLKGNFKHIFYV